MKYLDMTFSDPASNLACDEALLHFCEANADEEILRIWEPKTYFVVVGYSNKVASEVNIAECAARAIPILRRVSGGGTVLQGPGCLNYCLILKHERDREDGEIAISYDRVLSRHQGLIERLSSDVIQVEGSSDLTMGGRKFSGNSQYRKRLYTLFHGSFLLHLEPVLIEACLPMPSRRPEYRQGRSHEEFLCNLHLSSAALRRFLKTEWRAEETFDAVPYGEIEKLVERRYSRAEWTFKF